MDRKASKSSRKILSEKVVISERKCGFLLRSFIQEVKKYTVLEEDKYASIVRVQEILADINISARLVVVLER